MSNELEASNNVEIGESSINVDLANFHKLISPNSKKGREFNEFMQGIMDKLLSKDAEQKDFFSKLNVDFCIQDNSDPSIARVANSDYPMDSSDLSGDNFTVMFNKNLLNKLKSEDEIAFIMGHELSHVMYRNTDLGFKDIHNNEEFVCDLNSMRLMNKAGFALDASITVDSDIYKNKSPELLSRIESRKNLIRNSYSNVAVTKYDNDRFNDVNHVKLIHKFEIPSSKDAQEVQIDKMIQNLQKVFDHGGASGFKDLTEKFCDNLGSEKASKFMVNLVSKATETFPAIDQIKENSSYRKYLSHPIGVLADCVPSFCRKEGKKLYPPEPIKKINKYFENNPKYYKGMEFVWDKLLKPNDNLGAVSKSKEY